jgi:hypothetical protein
MTPSFTGFIAKSVFLPIYAMILLNFKNNMTNI